MPRAKRSSGGPSRRPRRPGRTRRLAEALHELAKILSRRGRYAEAEPLAKRALAIR